MSIGESCSLEDLVFPDVRGVMVVATTPLGFELGRELHTVMGKGDHVSALVHRAVYIVVLEYMRVYLAIHTYCQ